MSGIKLKTAAGGSVTLQPENTGVDVTLTVPADNSTLMSAADLAAGSGSSLVGYTPAGTGAVAATVQSKLRERVSVKDFGAVGDGVADDTAAIQAAINYIASLSVAPNFDQGRPALYFNPGNYRITATLDTSGLSALSLFSDEVIGIEKTSIFCSNDAPILSINNRQRTTLLNLMFNGDKQGRKTGSASNKNTAPLITTAGDASLITVSNCDFRKGTIAWNEGAFGTWLKFVNCQFYLNDKAFYAPNGVDTVQFNECDIENNTVGFDVLDGGLGVFVVDKCYFEKSSDPPQMHYIKAAKPTLSNSKWLRNIVRFNKGVGSVCQFNNTHLTYISQIDTPPLFKTDSHVTSYALVSPNKFGGNQLMPLDQRNHVNPSVGYVVGDSLDYLIATNATRNSSGTSSATVEFLRDAVVVSSDAIAFKAGTDRYGQNNEYTTFGVVNNTGAALSVTALNTTTYMQSSAIYQSLLANGTFPAGSTTYWLKQGSVATSTSGAYLVVSNPGPTGGNLAYNRITHVPANCKMMYLLARMRNGNTSNIFVGGISTLNQYPSVQERYFDNGDGTYDDLVSLAVKVTPGSTLAKNNFAIQTTVGGADVYVKWVAMIPITGNESPVYAGTFTFNAPSIAAGGTTTTTIMADSDTQNDLKIANVGDSVRIIPNGDTQGIQCTGYVNATGQITARFTNPTTSAIDLGSLVYRWELTKQ